MSYFVGHHNGHTIIWLFLTVKHVRHETSAVESILSQYDIRFTRCHYGNEFYTSLYRKKDGRFKEWLLGRFCDFFFPINPSLTPTGCKF